MPFAEEPHPIPVPTRRLRLAHLALVVAVVAVGFAFLEPLLAVLLTSWLVALCVEIALGFGSFAELYALMAVGLPLFWALSEVVRRLTG